MPIASAVDQPVRDSATRLSIVTRPSASVVTTASPMLSSVTRSFSRFRASSRSARPCSSISARSALLDRVSCAVRSSTRRARSARSRAQFLVVFACNIVDPDSLSSINNHVQWVIIVSTVTFFELNIIFRFHNFSNHCMINHKDS